MRRTILPALAAIGLAAATLMVISARADNPHAMASIPLASGQLEDLQNDLFLVGHSQEKAVIVFDTSKDKVIGTLPLTLPPRHIGISKSTRTLAVIADGVPKLELRSLGDQADTILTLPFSPDLLTLSADGQWVAVGRKGDFPIALINVQKQEITALGKGPAGLADLMFSTDGNSLFAAGQELMVLDPRNELIPRQKALPVSAVSRAPDGRAIFARLQDGNIAVLNSRSLDQITRLDGRSAQAVPTATGSYLLLIDGPGGKITLVHGDTWETGQTFDSPEDAGQAYSGWFDSVAVIPSEKKQSLEILDLWRQTRLTDIALPAAARTGAVSADGSRLFLPLNGMANMAVVDLRERKLQKTVALPVPSDLAVLADSYGICH